VVRFPDPGRAARVRADAERAFGLGEFVDGADRAPMPGER